jgi:hypothetical protein
MHVSTYFICMHSAICMRYSARASHDVVVCRDLFGCAYVCMYVCMYVVCRYLFGCAYVCVCVCIYINIQRERKRSSPYQPLRPRYGNVSHWKNLTRFMCVCVCVYIQKQKLTIPAPASKICKRLPLEAPYEIVEFIQTQTIDARPLCVCVCVCMYVCMYVCLHTY